MHRQRPIIRFHASRISAVSATAALILLMVLGSHSASAQAFQVLHTFSGGDGSHPWAGITLNGTSLYGTTAGGGDPSCNCGTVYKLSRAGNGWLLTSLYRFHNQADGGTPEARVVFGPDGVLYGTTAAGQICCGTVFRLQPPASVCRSSSCLWTLTTILNFPTFESGYFPSYGALTFDAAGNIYGTTTYGGHPATCQGDGCGVVYELTRNGNSWSENVLYSFGGINDGGNPYSGVTFDQSGNLYGTASHGHDNGQYGVVYELVRSGSGWSDRVLYAFRNADDGKSPFGGVIFDQQGNLYGTTTSGGLGQGGTLFQLTPSGANWSFNLLTGLVGDPNFVAGPEGKLAMDSAGNLYGTTVQDGSSHVGNVFKLTPVNGGWVYTSLHDFSGGSDGAFPGGEVAVDAAGNIYGTTQSGGGGSCGCGVVWEITQ